MIKLYQPLPRESKLSLNRGKNNHEPSNGGLDQIDSTAQCTKNDRINIAEKTSDDAFKNVDTRNEDKKNHLQCQKLSKDYQTKNSGGKVNSNSL